MHTQNCMYIQKVFSLIVHYDKSAFNFRQYIFCKLKEFVLSASETVCFIIKN